MGKFAHCLVSGIPLLILVLALSRPASAEDAPSDFILTTEDYTGPDLAPAFVGNGYLGARIPFDGQGYREKPVVTLAQVQGLFTMGKLLPWTANVERRAAPPVWSSLDYDDGSGRYALDQGVVRHYRQSLDLHTGTLTTEIDWVSPGGRQVALRYDVLPDRARPHAALVRLRFTPAFTARVTVSDTLDPKTGRLLKPPGAGHHDGAQYIDLEIGNHLALATTLVSQDGSAVPAGQAPEGGVAQEIVLNVVAGRSYEVLKTVGFGQSIDDASEPLASVRAIEIAQTEAHLGYDRAKQDSDAAWSRLWAADIQIDGDPGLRKAARAALFALYASARDDLAWAPSPGGLSSDGYMGHVFWDSETWMYPVYLATAPGIAKSLLQYRIDRLPAARAFAGRSGLRGARYPWESARSGVESVPLAGFGNELHINGDIALAAWQYWLATGDRAWLEQAFPMLSGIADFWVSRTTANADGTRSIRGVVPPDENEMLRSRFGWFAVLAGGGSLVDDSLYTNTAARRSLTIAAEAATLVGRDPDPSWIKAAQALRIEPPGPDEVHPEYHGYAGGPVKQADVTLLSYPWEAPQSGAVTLADLDYYAARTDPNGPSMTDAIHSIVASEIGAPGCASYSFTRRSVDPFLRPPYSQFAETRVGGAFTFMTGAGGFLQEFIYGYTGLRWRADALWLDPSLPPQLAGVTLAALQWQGRTVRIAVRQAGTLLTLLSGPAMPIDSPDGAVTLTPDAPVTIKTRSPGTRQTENLALCRPALDSTAGPGPATAANDGSDATVWIASKPGQNLVIDLEREIALDTVVITRPPVLARAGKSLLGPGFALPVITRPSESSGEIVEISADGKNWSPIGRITAPGPRDNLPMGGQRARYLRLSASGPVDADRPLVIGDVVVRERQ